jgi:hypothetical protein
MKVLPRSVLLALPVLGLLAPGASGCAEEVVEAPPPRQTSEVVTVQPGGPAVAAGAPATVVMTDPALETWPSRNPDAAKALGGWVHDNPEAAARIFTFDGVHPGRSRALVRWAIHHPGEDISAFTSKHPEWEWFDRVIAAHHLGASQYLAWCRQYPAAAEELVQRPSGLRWVGDHLYAADWHPE